MDTFTCPKCKAKLQMTRKNNDDVKQTRCPSCGTWIQLPVREKQSDS